MVGEQLAPILSHADVDEIELPFALSWITLLVGL